MKEALKPVDYLFGLFPGPKTENWKYTNIKKILPKDILLDENKKMDDVDGEKLKKDIISINSPYLILFENGLLNKKRSIVPSGVTIKKIDPIKKENHSLHINPKGSGFSNKPKDSFLFKSGEKLDNLLKINNLYNTSTYVIEFEAGFVCNEYITLSNPRWEPSPPFGLIRKDPNGKSTSSRIIKISFAIRFQESEISRTAFPLLFIPVIGLNSKMLSDFDAIT